MQQYKQPDRRIDTVLRRRVQTPDPSGHRETCVRTRRQNRQERRGEEPRRVAASARPPAASLGGSDVRRKAGRVRAEAWEAQLPERDASVPRRTASQQASPQSPLSRCEGARDPFSLPFPRGDSEGFRGVCPSQGPVDRTWSRQTSTLVRREGEAAAREEPVRANRRRTADSERRPHRRAVIHARGLATRAVSGNGC